MWSLDTGIKYVVTWHSNIMARGHMTIWRRVTRTRNTLTPSYVVMLQCDAKFSIRVTWRVQGTRLRDNLTSSYVVPWHHDVMSHDRVVHRGLEHVTTCPAMTPTMRSTYARFTISSLQLPWHTLFRNTLMKGSCFKRKVWISHLSCSFYSQFLLHSMR